MGPTEEAADEACSAALGAENVSRGSLPGVVGLAGGGLPPPIAPPDLRLGWVFEDMWLVRPV